jgi:ligand-binding sensor domain-containing protein
VAAPADALAVTAVFPFGLTKELRYTPAVARWQTRFLVPKTVPDGVYRVVTGASSGQSRPRRWRIPLRAGQGEARGFWQPRGSHALQAVDARGGAVWIATEDSGVLRLHGDRFQVLDGATGLPSSRAVDVAATADGGAYVATLRHGLVRVAPDGRAHVVAPRTLDSWLLHVSATAVLPGALLVGTHSGAALVDLARERAAPFLDLPHPSVHALFVSDDAIWVATEGGTARFPRATAPRMTAFDEQAHTDR